MQYTKDWELSQVYAQDCVNHRLLEQILDRHTGETLYFQK